MPDLPICSGCHKPLRTKKSRKPTKYCNPCREKARIDRENAFMTEADVERVVQEQMKNLPAWFHTRHNEDLGPKQPGIRVIRMSDLARS